MTHSVDFFDLVAYIDEQMRISTRAFGPSDDPRVGTRLGGILAHIRKELIEIEARPDDPFEWADLIILALDGAWRQGITPAEIATALLTKQTINSARKWPDWRRFTPDDAIEHER